MNNWKKIKIEEVCSFINGYAFDSNKYVQNGIQVIRITNVQKGYISDTDKKFYKEEKELERYKLIEGDLLISLTGNVGRVGVIKSENLPAYLNQRVSCVRIKNNNLLNKRFLFNFLNSDSFEKTCIKNSKGIAQKNISTVWLREIKIPLPPMEEQKKIAARLDAVSDLLAKQKQLLSEQDNLIQSLFYDMFGDPLLNTNGYLLKYFDEIFSRIKNGANIKQSKLKNGLPITRIETISNYSVNRNRMGFAGINDIANYLEYELQDNDILISHINSLSHIGKSALYRKTPGEKIIHGMNLLCLRPIQSKVNPLYIKHLFKTSYFKKKILSITKPAVNQASFTVSDFKKLTFPLPPFELQQKFAAVAEQIESEKSKIKSAIAETQTLFNALMAEYFEE